jgi:translation elongation factor EF-1beta
VPDNDDDNDGLSCNVEDKKKKSKHYSLKHYKTQIANGLKQITVRLKMHQNKNEKELI